MTRKVFLVVLTHLAYVDADNTTNVMNNSNTNPLLHNIRRKLMVDNYDYMSTETEEPFPIVHELDNADTTIGETFSTLHDYDMPDLLGPHVNDIFIPTPRSSPRDEELSSRDDLSEDYGIVKNDLLYYLDDNRLKTETDANDISSKNDNLDVSSSKVKYKILKMKQPLTLSGRRVGNNKKMYRRFLEEERSDGVAIISLDNEPLPEFRLHQALGPTSSGEEHLEIAPVSETSD